MQMEEWPFFRPEKGLSSRMAVTAAHVIAEEFRNGTLNGSPWLWETPIEKLATRNWELIAKQTGEEALSRSLRALQEADARSPRETTQRGGVGVLRCLVREVGNHAAW